MPTNRKVRTKKRKVGTAASPSLISALADPGSLRATVDLQITIGNAPFDTLSDTDAGIAEGIEILRRLWPVHREHALEFCISHHGAGVRPVLWWEFDSPAPRPFVKPRDWCLDGDRERYETERAAADLEFLKSHKLLTREELRMLAEIRKEKKLGPDLES